MMYAGIQGLMSLMEPDYLVGPTQIAKVMRLLFIAGVVARADGDMTDGELVVLYSIAEDLDVSRSILSQVLDGEVELDWVPGF